MVFQTFSLESIKESISKYHSSIFDCYVTYKLNSHFKYSKTYTIKLPSDLEKKKESLTQQNINQFISNILCYIFMQYGSFDKDCKKEYDIHLCEINQFFSLESILKSESFSESSFEIYKFVHSGREYFKAGNSNEDPIEFRVIKYFMKYNNVFVTDRYLESFLSSHNSGSSCGSRMEEKKELTIDEDLTKEFIKGYDKTEHFKFYEK